MKLTVVSLRKSLTRAQRLKVPNLSIVLLSRTLTMEDLVLRLKMDGQHFQL